MIHRASTRSGVSAGAPRVATLSTRFEWLTAASERFRNIEREPLPGSVIALLEATAAATPDALALHFIDGGEELSYAELLDQVRRLSGALSALGIGRASHVGVMLPNLPQMPITWLALAAIGAVMVPINTRYTSHELHYVLADSGARHLVLHRDFVPLLDAMAPLDTPLSATIVVGAPAPDGHQDWQQLVDSNAPDFKPAIQPGLDDVLNIQYTSGTTGWPKGCLLTQRYWLTCAKAYADCDSMRYRRILSSNPFFYMTPQWLMLMAFFHGASLYVAPYLSLTRLGDWLRQYGIDYCWFPMDAMTQVPPRPDDALPLLQRGNLAIHRGELHAALERRFGFPARAAFGMTEIGVGLIMPIEAAEMVGSGSCGIAGPFREVRIADPDGQTLPDGVSGELLIRGPGILLGYHNKPEATAAAFHGDWFRTGDLAVRDADGFVTIQGRIKEMIRRAGENISATEVEAALLAIPGIAEAAVLPVPDALRGEEVKAYIVLADGNGIADLPPEQIIAQCSQRLAAFKIPRLIEYRTEPLPRSTSGKVRKPDLILGKADLRAGSWDRVAGSWV